MKFFAFNETLSVENGTIENGDSIFIIDTISQEVDTKTQEVSQTELRIIIEREMMHEIIQEIMNMDGDYAIDRLDRIFEDSQK